MAPAFPANLAGLKSLDVNVVHGLLPALPLRRRLVVHLPIKGMHWVGGRERALPGAFIARLKPGPDRLVGPKFSGVKSRRGSVWESGGKHNAQASPKKRPSTGNGGGGLGFCVLSRYLSAEEGVGRSPARTKAPSPPLCPSTFFAGASITCPPAWPSRPREPCRSVGSTKDCEAFSFYTWDQHMLPLLGGVWMGGGTRDP